MKKFISLLLVLAIVPICTFTAFAEPDPVRIGILLPLTGSNSSQGAQSTRAINMAVEEINEAGGIEALGGAKIETVFADTQSNTATAVSEAERLITQEGVCMISGCYHSAVTLTVAAVCDRYGVVLFSPVSSEDAITGSGYEYIFKLAENTSWRIEMYFKYITEMAEEAGVEIKNIALVYENSSFGQGAHNGWMNNYEQYGWNVVLDEPYDPNMTDASSLVTKIAQANADVLFLANSGMNASIILAQGMKQQKVNPFIMQATAGAQSDPDYLEGCGTDCLGMLDVTAYEMDLNRPYAKEVGQKFLDKYGVYLNNEGAKEYVGMYVVKDVLERAASVDHEAIYEAFAATDITEGICTMYGPHICFDETGQYPYKTSLFLVQNQLVDGTVKRVSVYPRELASEGFELIFPYDYAND